MRLRAAHNLDDLVRDGRLTNAIGVERQSADQVRGVLRRRVHRGHPGSVLTRDRFEQSVEDLRLDELWKQPLEDLVRLLFVDVIDTGVITRNRFAVRRIASSPRVRIRS